MQPNLPDLYNDGIIPAPKQAGEPARLPYPAWRPTPAQVEAARKNLRRNLAILVLMIAACLLVFALTLGWRP